MEALCPYSQEIEMVDEVDAHTTFLAFLISTSSKERDVQFYMINLRPFDQSDIDDFMVWASDDKVSHFCLWDTYKSKEAAMHYIKDIAIPHPWLRAICIENKAIGAISVAPNSGMGVCRAELGYVLAYQFWGKGIMTRVVKLVVANIFKEWPNLERLEAFVDVENGSSQRVLEKVGFRREGVLRKYMFIKGRSIDMVIFSLLALDTPFLDECF